MSTEVKEPVEKRSFFANLFAKNSDAVAVIEPKNVESTHEAGVERLRKMYSRDQYGNWSKELLLLTQSGSMSFICGGAIGAIIQSRDAYMTFIENNHATKFANSLDAKRQLQRTMYLAFVKGGWRWGSRISFFSVTYTTLMTTISLYRGKESLMEYLIAGWVTGGVCRMNMGLKGAFAGSMLGFALGGVAGSLSLLVLKLGGTSMDELRDFSKQMSDARHDAILKSQKEYMLKEHAELSGLAADATVFENLKVDEETK